MAFRESIPWIVFIMPLYKEPVSRKNHDATVAAPKWKRDGKDGMNHASWCAAKT